jgi:hypothetical protein
LGALYSDRSVGRSGFMGGIGGGTSGVPPSSEMPKTDAREERIIGGAVVKDVGAGGGGANLGGT